MKGTTPVMRRDDTGSIALFMAVMMVATGLILITVFTVERGLAASRRSGDSASALQVADAGVNAAVQHIPNVPEGDPAAPMSIGPFTGGVGEASYEWSASRVSPQLWNVVSTGTDTSGVKRRIRAQATALPLFGRPIHIRAAASLRAGNILDSYTDQNSRCTGAGIMTVDDPSVLTFIGNGGGNTNCQKLTNPSWEWSIDGCDIPGDDAALSTPVPTKNGNGENIIDVARCPNVPNTKRVSPKLPMPTEGYPTTGTFFGNTSTAITCDGVTTLPGGGTQLTGGRVYVASTLTLKDGCRITSPVATKPVHIYASTIDIGAATGPSGNVINPPVAGFKADADSTTCVGWTTAAAVVPGGYCQGWPGQLFLHLVGNGQVTFQNKVRYFWGVISAPQGSLNLSAEQLEAWGAAVAGTLTGGVQFSWHFDESLKTIIGSGRFGVDNWREEALRN